METMNGLAGAASGLEKHLGYWLRRVSNTVSAEFAQALRAKQTSVAEWVVLHILFDRGHATSGELAEAMGLTRGAVSKIVDKLQEKKWLEIQTTEGDNRIRLLSLSREGGRNFPLLTKIANQNEAYFFTCLDAGERRTLRSLLQKLAARNDIHDAPTE